MEIRIPRLVASWRYPPPYDFYDGDVEPVLNPERHFEARDDNGTLIGFYYFEPNPPDLDYGPGSTARPHWPWPRASASSSPASRSRERYQPRRCAALIHLLANRVEVTEHG